ncbi:hypothetical protein GU3_08805 [Oceanimonas sp. GK1]|uniref:hypothetical protein n=1 Tax=Oceanimonas sp. (strain GK1 / IBRC-M 10197) TaxID=511062 RepID=UPI000249543D|nr:hypothetical protein [Oceanimonas sp. GK1]AEY01517.1 hypothetical protein GU3_08805 [Oceanimonas sp. GK1]
MPHPLCALLLLMLTACAGAGDRRLVLAPAGSFPAALSESSGLVAQAGGFVSHNDSGKAAELFVLDRRGALVQRVPVPVPNRDWEDITRHGNTLYLADTGNNGGRRQDLRIVTLTLSGEGLAEPGLLPVSYREQRNFQPPRHQHNFDAEALAWVNGELWLLTKRWLDQHSAIYRLRPDAEPAPLAEWQRLHTHMLVTGADFDAASQTLLLVGYSRGLLDRRAFAWLYPVRNHRVVESAGQRYRLSETGQFEAIALGTDGHLYFSREGTAPQLFRSQHSLSRLLASAASKE